MAAQAERSIRIKDGRVEDATTSDPYGDDRTDSENEMSKPHSNTGEEAGDGMSNPHGDADAETGSAMPNPHSDDRKAGVSVTANTADATASGKAAEAEVSR